VGRASAGALEHVKVARVGNLVQALETLKARGVWIVGFDATGRERWDSVDLSRPVCLVLGGEGRGIRRLVRERCDHLVSIPHFGHVSSLNVSVAAGIALYEVVRQRGAVPSPVRPIPARPAEGPTVLGPHPDDEENDPGAAPDPPLPSPEAPANAADDERPEAEPASLPHVDIHGDEVAWGKGPTVLKPISFRRGRRLPARRRKTGSRRPAAEAGAGSREGSEEKAATKSANPGEAPAARKGRRRRRRKRPVGTKQEASVSEPATPPSDPTSSSQPLESGEKDASAPRGKRRSRRRRR
jgi:tRNA(Leu) C34 or U34 (ribose-2'-O)-methylase TrmL